MLYFVDVTYCSWGKYIWDSQHFPFVPVGFQADDWSCSSLASVALWTLETLSLCCFCLHHFCPGVRGNRPFTTLRLKWNMVLDVPQASRNVITCPRQPVVASDGNNLAPCDSGWYRGSRAVRVFHAQHVDTLVLVYLFHALSYALCSQWDPQLVRCPSKQTIETNKWVVNNLLEDRQVGGG